MGSAGSSSGQVISVPKGGGALHGIGEKFSPDLFTGTGNFTVPIALPSGRNCDHLRGSYPGLANVRLRPRRTRSDRNSKSLDSV
jgi:hypothetical protein